MELTHKLKLISCSILVVFALSSLAGGCIWKPFVRVNLPTSTLLPVESTSIPAEKAPTAKFLDVPYASLSESQKLDIYIPVGGGPYPLIIIIHGGGFETGDKAGANEKQRVNLLVRRGFAVASINYRLSGEAVYPAQIHDVKTAVRFLRSKAAEYRIDPNRLGAWGASAGGTLASLLGTTCGVEELEGRQQGQTEYSSCVSAVVDWFGLVDLLAMDAQFEGTGCEGGHNDPDSAESRLVGAPLQTVPELAAKTNPMNYISADDAAFFIQHGSEDCRVPPEQSRLFAEALSGVLGEERVKYEEIEGAGHGGKIFRTDENYQKIIDFLNEFLN
jgi:acetyl esterase/lipase